MSTDSGACPPLPDAFVRLRYFFGKRLGVADLRDEQAYHRGKMRFHNRHLHGSGVVCGLGLSPFDATDPENTVLRVGRGAALGSCGDEILVSHDQCIDLSAWFRRAAEAVEGTGELFPPEGSVVGGVLPVCIALRYRECPTTPEAAPRDPCNSCDTGGSEYGRVQEGFELRVLVGEESEGLEIPLLNPSAEALDLALSESSTVEELRAVLGLAVTQGCAPSRDPDWVLLGCLGLVLDSDGNPEALTPAEGWGGPSSFLLSTAALQHLLLQRLMDAQPVFEATVSPVKAAGLTISEDGGTSRFLLALDKPAVEDTLSGAAVELRRLGGRNGWVDARVAVTQVEADGAHQLSVTVSAPRTFLQAGRFQLRVGHERSVVTQDFTPVYRNLFFELEAGPDGVVLVNAVDHGRPA